VVDVMAHDYAFTAPDTIAAGATTFRMTNHGREPHHVMVLRFEGGRTLGDFVEYMKTLKPGQEKLPAWARELGGPNPASGAKGWKPATATITLEPGSHALICVIPSPDGKPHAMKGMMRPLTVVASAEPAPMPAADLTMELRDYGFELSAPLAAGRRTIRVVNAAATQWHEAVMIRVYPGKTPEQAMQWLHTQQGEPAGELAGGVAPIGTGLAASFEADLVPGRYLLVCFLPDHQDGKAHLEHGMIRTIEVAAAR
jgi:hypothetical protein